MPPLYKIPYFAPIETLSALLPSTEEIEARADLNPNHVQGQHVVRVGEYFVVKHGWLVSPTEGGNMLYVSKNSNVPVPQVYAIYQRDDAEGRKCIYIVMEHVDGQALNDCWNTLKPDAKEAIASRLCGCLDQLRALPSPDGFSNLNIGPLYDPVFLTDEEQPVINGPFKTETEIAETLVFRLEQESDRIPAEKAS